MTLFWSKGGWWNSCSRQKKHQHFAPSRILATIWRLCMGSFPTSQDSFSELGFFLGKIATLWCVRNWIYLFCFCGKLHSAATANWQRLYDKNLKNKVECIRGAWERDNALNLKSHSIAKPKELKIEVEEEKSFPFSQCCVLINLNDYAEKIINGTFLVI